ncbi:MAG: hypothetical protein IKQ46_03470 [Bacteroidales bacterium]|nr:hypothetical protein [Bacteroidales bacterium]
MKFLKSFCILFSLLLIFQINASAQQKIGTFNTLPAQLIKDVESYTGVKTTLNKDLKATVKAFVDKLEKHEIDEVSCNLFVPVMNLYVTKHATTNVHMLTLIKTINAFWDYKQVDELEDWCEFMLSKLQDPSQAIAKIHEICDFTLNLFVHNGLEVSASKSWYMSSNDYHLKIEDDENGFSTLFVDCNNTDVRCRIKGDSSLVIYKTSGRYNSFKHEWVGNGGHVDWSRGGLSPDSIYAELGSYVINTHTQQFSADNVQFYNKQYFSHPLTGYYEDKVVMNGVGPKARYPQFDSYETDIKIPNLAEGINYVGGYAQHGVMFMGTATENTLPPHPSPSRVTEKMTLDLHITKEQRPLILALNEDYAQYLKGGTGGLDLPEAMVVDTPAQSYDDDFYQDYNYSEYSNDGYQDDVPVYDEATAIREGYNTRLQEILTPKQYEDYQKSLIPDSLPSSYAKLIFNKNGSPFVTAESTAFVFGLNRLEGQNVKVTILLKEGQITHPGVKLKYFSDRDSLILFKSKDGLENATFSDTYHQLTIDVNQMEWHRDDTLLVMATRPASPIGYAVFESSEYYTTRRYNELQGRDKMNPLVVLRDYIESRYSVEFTCQDLQHFINTEEEGMTLSPLQVHQMLMKLSYQGFVTYDVNSKSGKVEQKLHDWIGSHSGHKDYDCISIQSKFPDKKVEEDLILVVNKKEKSASIKNSELKEKIRDGDVKNSYVNAILNLNNSDLNIFYPNSFDIAQERMVKALPDSVLVIHKGMDMDFGGKVQAGLVDFYGKNFKFNYDGFNIGVIKADSMAFLAVTTSQDGKRHKIDSVRSVIEHINGTLYLDSATNKSGVVELNQFPRLVTTDTSYVYYDNLTSEKYDRDKFHMTVYPFVMDSLNFIGLGDVKTKGKFESGIFPDLYVTLQVQPDLSLGFVMPTPEEGMDLFSGKGSYHNTVTLNADGLSGDGEIRYLTAVARAKQYQFYPDSVAGICYYVDVKAVTKPEVGKIKDVKSDYPSVSSDSALVSWRPERDLFSIISNDTLLKIYDNSIDFNGQIDLTPNKMIASGELLYNKTGLFSEKFTMHNTSLDADSAMFCNFDLAHPGDSTGFFYTDRYNAKLDFTNKYGQFIVSNDSARVYFPQHKYEQRTDFFTWTIDKNQYNFGQSLRGYDEKMIAKSDEEFEKIRYMNSSFKPVRAGVSLTCTRDTLIYGAQSTSFNESDNILNVNEPGVIKIVDAKIDPSGIIQVNPGGEISKFENALITSNLDTLYHKIINATVKIRDKYYFKAMGGQYEYRNENSDISYLKVDSLEIRKIKTDTLADSPKIRTVFGIGSVRDDQHFMLSPQYSFSGKFLFTGNAAGIKFNGFAYIKQECDSSIMPFKFEGTLNPDHIVFPISDRVMDTAKVRLYSGFFYNEESSKLYSVFMGRKLSHRDVGVLVANKGLSYSITAKQYQIASAKRLNDPSVPENYLALYKNICDLYGEGNINLNLNVAPIEVVTKGSIYDQRDISKITVNSLMTVNLVIRQDVIKLMADEIQNTDGLKPMKITKNSIRKKLEFLCGHDTVETMMQDFSDYGEISKVPAALQKTFVFADLVMNFDTTKHAYRSSGNIGVASIGGVQINRYVPGAVEIISNKKKGDQITIYLEPEKGTWYYFNYSAGFLYCLSSNDDFKQKIMYTKDKDRVTKLKDSEYQFIIATDAARNKFVGSFGSISGKNNNNDDSQNRKDEINKQVESETTKPENQAVESDTQPVEDVDNGVETTQPTENQSQPEPEENDFEEEPVQEQSQPQEPEPQQSETQPAATDDDEEQDFIDE